MRTNHRHHVGCVSAIPSIVTRVLLVAAACVVLSARMAGAQAVACTAPPPAPPNATASVTSPGSATAAAVVTVHWTAVATSGPTAVTSYRIEVGNAPGATNIAALDTGTTDVSSQQMATSGTYYARVRALNGCGVSGPSSEPVVTVTGAIAAGEPAARIVMAHTSWGDAMGDAVVVGEMRGAWGGRAAPFVMVKARFLDSADKEVGSDSDYIIGRARRLIETRAVDEATVAAG